MAKANNKNNNKYVEQIKLNTSLVKELDKYNEVIESIDKLGRLALADESCTIDIQLFIKVTPTPEDKGDPENKDPRDLLNSIKNAESPEAFLEQLDKARGGQAAEPKYHELQVDELDNTTFLAMLDKILGNYKLLSNQLLTKIKQL